MEENDNQVSVERARSKPRTRTSNGTLGLTTRVVRQPGHGGGETSVAVSTFTASQLGASRTGREKVQRVHSRAHRDQE